MRRKLMELLGERSRASDVRSRAIIEGEKMDEEEAIAAQVVRNLLEKDENHNLLGFRTEMSEQTQTQVKPVNKAMEVVDVEMVSDNEI